jgi:hypothetical protein
MFDDQTRPQFVTVITALARTFSRDIDEATFTGYEMGLSDIPIDRIKTAVARAIRERKFMPTVFEIRELAGELTPDTRVVKAWDAFQRAVVAHGSYASVDFDDPVINATVRNLGGWERVCGLPCSEFDKWLRKDFVKTYTALCQMGIGPDAGAPLLGYHDRGNLAGGFGKQVKSPLRIACELPPHRLGVEPAAIKAPSVAVPALGLIEDIGQMPKN